MDYTYNGFNEPPPQPQDRVHEMLMNAAQAKAAANPPPLDPMEESMMARQQFGQQYPELAGQGNANPLDIVKQKIASGDPQAGMLAKRVDMFTGGDPTASDAALQFLIDHPNEIDPSNSYQVNTALAQWSKQSGYNAQATQRQPLSPQELAMQDLGNIASGKGTNVIGLQQQDQKEIADINLRQAQADKFSALAANGGSSSGGGTTMQVYRMLKQKYPEADDMTLLRIAQNKISTDLSVNPNTGVVDDMTGAAAGRGDLAYGEKFGGASGTNAADLIGKPKIESAVTIARAMAEKLATQSIADVQAMPLIDQLDSLNEKTFDTPYANIAQVPAKFLDKYQEQTTAYDLMQQNRTNLAIPLAKALGVNPTDRDFNATLDSIFDITATKASRRAQIANLKQRISTRLANNPIGQGAAPAAGIEQTKNINGVNYHKVNGQWMQE